MQARGPNESNAASLPLRGTTSYLEHKRATIAPQIEAFQRNYLASNVARLAADYQISARCSTTPLVAHQISITRVLMAFA